METPEQDTPELERLTTEEVGDYLRGLLASFPSCGPIALAAGTTRVAAIIRQRGCGLDWARTSYVVAEAYRRVLPYSHVFRIDGLDMWRIYRDHAAAAYRDAQRVFLDLGDELEAARCDAALHDPRW
jgi:hypothetical protein